MEDFICILCGCCMFITRRVHGRFYMYIMWLLYVHNPESTWKILYVYYVAAVRSNPESTWKILYVYYVAAVRS